MGPSVVPQPVVPLATRHKPMKLVRSSNAAGAEVARARHGVGMTPRLLRLPALLLASLALIRGAELRPLSHQARSRPALLPQQLRTLITLRGGDEEAPAAEEEVAAEAVAEPAAAERPTAVKQPPPTLADEEPPATCWSAVQKVLSFLGSLLVPNHNYAKAGAEDMLDETGKMCGYAPDDESWRTQRKKLNLVELSPATRKRVLRDLRRFKSDESPGLELEDAECLTDWVIKLVGANDTVFAGEIYRIRVRFHADYPSRPPTVTFMRPAPFYEHFYTNGMICLDLLSNAWDSRLDPLAVCLSLQSMMSSAKKKSRPPDNEMTSRLAQGQDPREMAWHPHDDEC